MDVASASLVSRNIPFALLTAGEYLQHTVNCGVPGPEASLGSPAPHDAPAFHAAHRVWSIEPPFPALAVKVERVAEPPLARGASLLQKDKVESADSKPPARDVLLDVLVPDGNVGEMDVEASEASTEATGAMATTAACAEVSERDVTRGDLGAHAQARMLVDDGEGGRHVRAAARAGPFVADDVPIVEDAHVPPLPGSWQAAGRAAVEGVALRVWQSSDPAQSSAPPVAVFADGAGFAVRGERAAALAVKLADSLSRLQDAGMDEEAPAVDHGDDAEAAVGDVSTSAAPSDEPPAVSLVYASGVPLRDDPLTEGTHARLEEAGLLSQLESALDALVYSDNVPTKRAATTAASASAGTAGSSGAGTQQATTVLPRNSTINAGTMAVQSSAGAAAGSGTLAVPDSPSVGSADSVVPSHSGTVATGAASSDGSGSLGGVNMGIVTTNMDPRLYFTTPNEGDHVLRNSRMRCPVCKTTNMTRWKRGKQPPQWVCKHGTCRRRSMNALGPDGNVYNAFEYEQAQVNGFDPYAPVWRPGLAATYSAATRMAGMMSGVVIAASTPLPSKSAPGSGDGGADGVVATTGASDASRWRSRSHRAGGSGGAGGAGASSAGSAHARGDSSDVGALALLGGGGSSGGGMLMSLDAASALSSTTPHLSSALVSELAALGRAPTLMDASAGAHSLYYTGGASAFGDVGGGGGGDGNKRRRRQTVQYTDENFGMAPQEMERRRMVDKVRDDMLAAAGGALSAEDAERRAEEEVDAALREAERQAHELRALRSERAKRALERSRQHTHRQWVDNSSNTRRKPVTEGKGGDWTPKPPRIGENYQVADLPPLQPRPDPAGSSHVPAHHVMTSSFSSSVWKELLAQAGKVVPTASELCIPMWQAPCSPEQDAQHEEAFHTVCAMVPPGFANPWLVVQQPAYEDTGAAYRLTPDPTRAKEWALKHVRRRSDELGLCATVLYAVEFDVEKAAKLLRRYGVQMNKVLCAETLLIRQQRAAYTAGLRAANALREAFGVEPALMWRTLALGLSPLDYLDAPPKRPADSKKRVKGKGERRKGEAGAAAASEGQSEGKGACVDEEGAATEPDSRKRTRTRPDETKPAKAGKAIVAAPTAAVVTSSAPVAVSDTDAGSEGSDAVNGGAEGVHEGTPKRARAVGDDGSKSNSGPKPGSTRSALSEAKQKSEGGVRRAKSPSHAGAAEANASPTASAGVSASSSSSSSSSAAAARMSSGRRTRASAAVEVSGTASGGVGGDLGLLDLTPEELRELGPELRSNEMRTLSPTAFSTIFLGFTSVGFDIWSQSERQTLTRAMYMHGKDFLAISKKHMPSRSLQAVVSFYYRYFKHTPSYRDWKERRTANSEWEEQVAWSWVHTRRPKAGTLEPPISGAERAAGNEAQCCNCSLGGELICCDGPCRRSFHPECTGMEQGRVLAMDEWVCPQCRQGRHECFMCGDAGADGVSVFLCSRSCGKFYHLSCLLRHPTVRFPSPDMRANVLRLTKLGVGTPIRSRTLASPHDQCAHSHAATDGDGVHNGPRSTGTGSTIVTSSESESEADTSDEAAEQRAHSEVAAAAAAFAKVESVDRVVAWAARRPPISTEEVVAHEGGAGAVEPVPAAASPTPPPAPAAGAATKSPEPAPPSPTPCTRSSTPSAAAPSSDSGDAAQRAQPPEGAVTLLPLERVVEHVAGALVAARRSAAAAKAAQITPESDKANVYQSLMTLDKQELYLREVVLSCTPVDFDCPLHTCARCGGGLHPDPGPVHYRRCARCPTAFHTECAPPGSLEIADELIDCGAH